MPHMSVNPIFIAHSEARIELRILDSKAHSFNARQHHTHLTICIKIYIAIKMIFFIHVVEIWGLTHPCKIGLWCEDLSRLINTFSDHTLSDVRLFNIPFHNQHYWTWFKDINGGWPNGSWRCSNIMLKFLSNSSLQNRLMR